MIKRIYLLLMLFGGCLFSMRAAVKEEIYVNHIADTVEIGNEFLARKFLVKNDKVRTCMIENKRMGKEVSRIIPETISEDFIIRTLSADSVVADIHSSDLFLQRVQVTDEGKNGKKLVFHYKGFRHQEVDWQVDMVLTLEEGKHYMRKYLEITVPDSQRHLARLDYIDFEPMSLPEGYAVWTHPVMEQGVGGVSRNVREAPPDLFRKRRPAQGLHQFQHIFSCRIFGRPEKAVCRCIHCQPDSGNGQIRFPVPSHEIRHTAYIPFPEQVFSMTCNERASMLLFPVRLAAE